MQLKKFQKTIYQYYDVFGRDLPWRKTNNPYNIVISEVMLQQTQVDRVLPKYNSFLKKFPTFKKLANAPLKEVLKEWQGLGYNRRGLMLQKLAQKIVKEHKGKLPNTLEELQDLPGIGPATAASISAFAFNKPVAFIETNVRTVYIHFFFKDQDNIADKELMPLIEKTLDKDNPRKWYNAIMDYGTKLKKEYPNPNRKSKQYVKQSKFEGSNRQLRGQILKELTRNAATLPALKKKIQNENLPSALEQLKQEGFIKKTKAIFSIA